MLTLERLTQLEATEQDGYRGLERSAAPQSDLGALLKLIDSPGLSSSLNKPLSVKVRFVPSECAEVVLESF